MEPTGIPTIARIRGWLLIILGVCLSVGMAALAVYMGSVMNNNQPGGSHWTGSHEMTVRVFQLFASIFVFGLVSIGGGVFQLRRGRPSWLAMIILIVLVVVMYFLGQNIMQMPR